MILGFTVVKTFLIELTELLSNWNIFLLKVLVSLEPGDEKYVPNTSLRWLDILFSKLNPIKPLAPMTRMGPGSSFINDSSIRLLFTFATF